MTKNKSLYLLPHEPRGLLSGEIQWLSRTFRRQPEILLDYKRYSATIDGNEAVIRGMIDLHGEVIGRFKVPWKPGDVLAGKEPWEASHV